VSTSGSEAASPLRAVADGVRVALKVTPKAPANRLLGCADDAAGGRILKVAVTAAPQDGKANAAVIELLAQAWRLPKRDLAIVAGAATRRKVVHVAGDPTTLLSKLRPVLGDG
jgi:uncharacterized protein (TIGR00251 family)